MKNYFTSLFLLLILSILMFSCGESTDVVKSGSYQGTIDKIEPEKDEIYVETDEGQRLELYFTEETQLTRNGQPVEFSVMEKGMKVEVEVEKVGQRLDPVSVNLLE